jgi:hypothetical protein
MTEPRRTSIQFTGRNATPVLDWLTREAGMPATERWFLTKGMTAATGGQAWRYARDGQEWPDDVKAAVYSPTLGSWYAVAPDSVFRREDGHVWVEGTEPDACPTRAPFRRRLTILSHGRRSAPWYVPGEVLG